MAHPCSLTHALAAERLTTQSSPLKIHGRSFLAETGSGQGWVAETSPDGVTTNPIRYLLGGKGLFYILTELGDGRLQALPLAYDVRRREWFDAVSSARGPHTAGRDPALDDWHNPSRTFQVACVKCHSSQSVSAPDPGGAVFPKTTWLEPGINCEVCHGPRPSMSDLPRRAQEESRPPTCASSAAEPDRRQNNATAAVPRQDGPHHRRLPPGGLCFDHFDLVTLESADYHPDGRDIGENYTMTSWLMSPCAKAGGPTASTATPRAAATASGRAGKQRLHAVPHGAA